jgi:hypothetical protein
MSARLAVDTRAPLVLSSAEGSVSPNIERLMREQVLSFFFFLVIFKMIKAKVDNSMIVQEAKKVLELNPRSDLIKRMNKALIDCQV